ncbi:MAG: hypothetical protein K940chlam7_01574 [Chlamydiae bacterium]|nr:hypothetical protein [Chlamydiota bacterium]
MGTKGRAIVKLDVEDLINKLNRALADEWYAYYQYWIGAKVVTGPMRDAIVQEMLEHAGDELRHAGLLVDRIIQLNGTPLLSPDEWKKTSICGYLPPLDPHVLKVLEQNIEAEQCAIGVYSELLELTENKDPITYQMVLEILQDEVEHEEDLQALQEDIKG